MSEYVISNISLQNQATFTIIMTIYQMKMEMRTHFFTHLNMRELLDFMINVISDMTSFTTHHTQNT